MGLNMVKSRWNVPVYANTHKVAGAPDVTISEDVCSLTSDSHDAGLSMVSVQSWFGKIGYGAFYICGSERMAACLKGKKAQVLSKLPCSRKVQIVSKDYVQSLHFSPVLPCATLETR